MREFRPIILLLLFVGGMFCLPPDAMYALRQVALAATTYYVQTDGNNANAGTSVGAANAWADPGYACSQMSNRDKCYIKAGTYTLTTTIAGEAGPIVVPADESHIYEGYYATPGDKAMNGATFSPPIIDTGGTTPGGSTYVVTLSSVTSYQALVMYVEVDCNDTANWNGFSIAANSLVYRARAIDCVTGFYSGSAEEKAIECLASSCANGFQMSATRCHADACGTGFYYASWSHCLATACGYGFRAGNYNRLLNNVAYACTTHSFAANGQSNVAIACISVSNSGGFAYNTDTGGEDFSLIQCWHFNTTSGRTNGTPVYDILGGTLSEDPFVNSAAGDFRLKPNGADYASLAGVSGVYGQTDNRDIGAVQHADPTIVVPDAKYIYNGQTVTSNGSALVTGTLNASNISAAKGSGSNLSAGILKKDDVVDDVTGTLEAGSGGGETSHVWVR